VLLEGAAEGLPNSEQKRQGNWEDGAKKANRMLAAWKAVVSSADQQVEKRNPGLH
jgi:hypothetical protein